MYDNVDLQELVNMYAGTGELETTLSGKFTNKEKIKANRIIGVDVSRQGNEITKIPTQWVKIHYSKNRTHVVPTIKRTD